MKSHIFVFIPFVGSQDNNTIVQASNSTDEEIGGEKIHWKRTSLVKITETNTKKKHVKLGWRTHFHKTIWKISCVMIWLNFVLHNTYLDRIAPSNQ